VSHYVRERLSGIATTIKGVFPSEADELVDLGWRIGTRGNKAFGYDRSGAPDADYPAVQLMVRLRKQGASYQAIREALRQSGYTKVGPVSSIRKILVREGVVTPTGQAGAASPAGHDVSPDSDSQQTAPDPEEPAAHLQALPDAVPAPDRSPS